MTGDIKPGKRLPRDIEHLEALSRKIDAALTFNSRGVFIETGLSINEFMLLVQELVNMILEAAES